MAERQQKTVQTSPADFRIEEDPATPVRAAPGWTLQRIAQVAVATAIAILAVLARVWHTRSTPLWLDEAYSLFAAQRDWHFLWAVVPTYETHPPLYYSLLHLWVGLFGESVVALRSLGHLAGFATLGVLWALARELERRLDLGRLVAPATLALAAFSWPLVEMARQVRPYPILILAYAVALLALFRATRPDRRSFASPAFATYCAAYALVLWLHNLGPLYGAALGIAAFLIVARRDLPAREWAVFFGGHALAILIWIPAFLMLRDQATGWIRSTWLTFELRALHWQLMALWGAPGKLATIPTCLLLALGAERIALRGAAPRIAAALLVAMILPALLSVVISLTVTPVFIPRTLTATAIPALLLSGVAIGALDGWRRPLALVCGVIVIMTMATMVLEKVRARPEQDWYRALAWLAPRYRPGDIVLAYPNEGALPFDDAMRDLRLAIPAHPVPGPVPQEQYPVTYYPTGSRGVVSLPTPILERIAAEPGVARAPVVWLLRLGPEAYDPDDAFLHVLERRRRLAARFVEGSIDIAGLRQASPLPAMEGAGVGGPTR